MAKPMTRQPMTKQAFFIAGTDTDVGKTCISVALLQQAKERGLKTLGLKPIAAGCQQVGEKLLNDDALAIQEASSEHLDYSIVNPIALEPAIAPHIAAEQVGVSLSTQSLAEHCSATLSKEKYHFALVEGAGGWQVPLNDKQTMADLAIALALPVVLVVGVRLGCISHALLTAEAIAADGLPLAGWVANQIDPNMPFIDENITALKSHLSCPFLGHIPFLSNMDDIHKQGFLDIDKLLEIDDFRINQS